jgi:hypothetical protein
MTTGSFDGIGGNGSELGAGRRGGTCMVFAGCSSGRAAPATSCTNGLDGNAASSDCNAAILACKSSRLDGIRKPR